MKPASLTGYESLALGVLDGGARVAASYPGGPSTKIVDTLIENADPFGIYVEWSSSEKAAFETAHGSALAGVRSAIIAKHVGINHIMDPLMTANLTDLAGGLLILAGDDPGAYGSQNEQDSRVLGAMAEIPILEPSTPAEGYQMTREAFRLSESLQIPVMIRFVADYTTSTGPVAREKPHSPIEPRFVDHNRFRALPAGAVENHRNLHAKIAKVSRGFDQPPFSRFNPQAGRGSVGLLACGHVAHRLAGCNLPAEISRFDLGTLHPFPEKALTEFLKRLQKVYVLEEVEPFVEIRLRNLAHKKRLRLDIYGKTTGHVPWEGDLHVARLAGFVEKIFDRPSLEESPPQRRYPSRQPLGAGCPYGPFFETLRDLVRDGALERPVVVGETGCLVRLNNPPLEMLDVKYAMGSSIGLASGLRRSGLKQKIIAATGDSAFFHSGINGLINAAHHQTDILIVVMDNRTVALTGFQTTVGTGKTALGASVPTFEAEKLAAALNIDCIRLLDAYDREAIAAALQKVWPRKGPCMIVVRGECPYIETKKCKAPAA